VGVENSSEPPAAAGPDDFHKIVFDAIPDPIFVVDGDARILPICAHSRKVRDDAKYWQNVESYCLRELAVDFSHGICPECLTRYYPDCANQAAQT
jgi:hypothetical protein